MVAALSCFVFNVIHSLADQPYMIWGHENGAALKAAPLVVEEVKLLPDLESSQGHVLRSF